MIVGLRVGLILAWLDVSVFALRKGRKLVEPAATDASMQELFHEADGRHEEERQSESGGAAAVILSSTCDEANSTDALIQCAEESVNMHASDMIANLESQGISKLDLGWPGTGFNQAAYGGQWQVMTALERRGGLRVENLIGASGGASSTVLALADVDRSSRTMLDTLMSSSWSSVTTSGEYRTYMGVMEQGNFSAVKSYGYASVICRSNRSVMYIVHDFLDEDQAAKSFAASGDVLSVIFGNGYNLGNGLKRCHDGGDLMGIGSTPLLYYNTAYGYTTGCNRACVVDLFKKGVEATIRVLLNSNLQVEPSAQGLPGSGGGSIAIQKPIGGTWALNQYRDYMRNGGFWEILTGLGSSSERVFVAGGSAAEL